MWRGSFEVNLILPRVLIYFACYSANEYTVPGVPLHARYFIGIFENDAILDINAS